MVCVPGRSAVPDRQHTGRLRCCGGHRGLFRVHGPAAPLSGHRLSAGGPAPLVPGSGIYYAMRHCVAGRPSCFYPPCSIPSAWPPPWRWAPCWPRRCCALCCPTFPRGIKKLRDTIWRKFVAMMLFSRRRLLACLFLSAVLLSGCAPKSAVSSGRESGSGGSSSTSAPAGMRPRRRSPSRRGAALQLKLRPAPIPPRSRLRRRRERRRLPAGQCRKDGSRRGDPDGERLGLPVRL